jgi:hypothetical protein
MRGLICGSGDPFEDFYKCCSWWMNRPLFDNTEWTGAYEI